MRAECLDRRICRGMGSCFTVSVGWRTGAGVLGTSFDVADIGGDKSHRFWLGYVGPEQS
ncbi:hypothetical protein AM571_PA00121 (plasmid) [Rhizobium etli 8C-3]|uniref:Uncharacterized protein n=1 Tax=Rhizobium etli 8C-3 TaxID=538025 RepID=A0A1L5PA23_RHIET|nr:hypothetical protein AM571_PA00121 [Rhizobium etli 8C-3]